MKKNKRVLTIFTQYINYIEYQYDTETLIIGVGSREFSYHYTEGMYERFLEDVRRNNKIVFETDIIEEEKNENVDVPDFSKIKKLKNNDENDGNIA